MKRHLFVLLLTLVVAGAANASTSKSIFAFTYAPYQLGDVELQTNNGNSVSTLTGWYDMGGNHTASNPDYIVGLCGSSDSCNGDDDVFNNFFTFNVSPGTTSAVLSVYLPNPGAITAGLSSFYCNCSSLTYQLWDVTTPVALVQADNSGAVAIYNDLGSGTLYGSVVVTPGDQGTQILINLDSAAIASINAAAASGQEWAIGGSIFGASTPEPGTISMVLTGLGAGLGMLRRRKLI